MLEYMTLYGDEPKEPIFERIVRRGVVITGD